MVLENGEVIEGMGQFCYLEDVLNGEGGSSMVSINRVRSGWKKFRELSGILINKKVALRLKARYMQHMYKVQCCMEVKPGQQTLSK